MTPEEIKKMQEDNLKLQKELEQQKEENKRLGNEAASALAAVNQKADGKRVLRRTPGSVKIGLMPAKGGKVKHTEMKIADGYPYLSIDSKSNTTAESTVVMKIAMGQELTEEEQKTNAAVASWSKKDAVEFLTAHAAKQVSWLVPVEAA